MAKKTDQPEKDKDQAAPTAGQQLIAQYELEAAAAEGPESPEATEIPEGTAPAIPSGGPERGSDGKFLPRKTPKSHPKHLVQMALELGFSDEDIANSETERLQESVYHANRLAMQEARERQHSRDREPSATPGMQPSDEYSLGEDEAAYDPDLVKAIKKAGSSQSQRIKQLEDKLAHFERAQHARTQETINEQLDGFFSEHPEVYGSGSVRTLRSDGRDFLKRRATIAIAETFRDGSVRDKMARAHAIVHGKQDSEPASRSENGRSRISEEDWEEATLARPTQRVSGPEQNGRSKAIKAVSAAMKEREGAERDSDSDNEKEGFL